MATRKQKGNMTEIFQPDETPTAVETPRPTISPPASITLPAGPPDDGPSFNGIPLDAYRRCARALLAYAVNLPSGMGRGTSDQVYRQIVENRVFPKYSSCGDLAHWLLYRLGVRAPWINRAENKQGGGWRVGANLNALCARGVGPNDQAFAPRNVDTLPELDAGDVYVISNAYGGHVICVRDFDPVTGVVRTSEYGQPGGMPRTRTLRIIGGHLFSDSSQVISILTLPHALGAPGLVGIDQATAARAVNSQLGSIPPGA